MGLTAPSLKFTGADNKPHSFRSERGWITVVGFLATEGKECCYFSPELTDTASRYWNRPVRVVQVALPGGKCLHGPGCVEACHIPALHLMALCDPSRVAYNAFGNPKANTVLLIGGDGKVAAVTTLKAIDKTFPQIDRLAAEAERESLPSYLQTYIE